MVYNLRQSQIPVHTKPNTSRVWTLDANGARLPVGFRDGSAPPAITVKTSYSSLASGTGDWPSPATDNTWLVLPVARFVTPELRRVVLVHWDIMGDYSNAAADAESIEAQLMVDASAVDSALTYAQTAAVTATGAIRFTADLTVIGNLTSQRFLMSTKVQIVNSSGTSIIGTEKFMFSTIDPLADQNLGWRIRKTVGGGGTSVMNIHSIMCYQVATPSGV